MLKNDAWLWYSTVRSDRLKTLNDSDSREAADMIFDQAHVLDAWFPHKLQPPLALGRRKEVPPRSRLSGCQIESDRNLLLPSTPLIPGSLTRASEG